MRRWVVCNPVDELCQIPGHQVGVFDHHIVAGVGHDDQFAAVDGGVERLAHGRRRHAVFLTAEN